MKSTRIFLVVSCSLWAATYGQQASQSPQKAVPQAAPQAIPQASPADIQKQIESFVDSKEFKEMQEQLNPGMGEMSKEAKDEFIKQTMQMYDYMQSLPEEEQQKMAQSIEQDVQRMLQQQPAQQAESQQIQEQLPTQDQPGPSALKPPVISTSDVETGEPKQLLETYVDMLEDINVTFANLLRVTTDNKREHQWTKIQPEVGTTLAYVKTIVGSEALLKSFASAEFNVLHNQIGGIVDSLQKHYEHMITADDAMLRKLSTEDAARAQPVPKHKKKQAKKARNAIIDILYNETQNIEFGAKAFFDKYATAKEKAQLKTELGKRMPQTRPTMLTKSGSGGDGYGSSSYGPRGDYYSPYYGGQGSQPSDSGRYSDRSSYDKGGFPGSGGASSKSDGVITGTQDAGKKGDKGISKPEEGKKAVASTEKGEKMPEGKGQKEYKAIKTDIDDLNKLIKKNVSQTAVAKTIKGLTKITDLEKLRDASLAIQDINMALTTLAGDVSKWLRTVDKLDDDIKSKSKKSIVDYLKDQKELQELIGMAGAATRAPIDASRPGAQEVQGLLSECTKGYQDLLQILKTADPVAVLKTVQEALNTLNAQVKSAILGDAAVKSAITADRTVTLLPDTFKIATQALQNVLAACKTIDETLDRQASLLSTQEKADLSAKLGAHLKAKKELVQLAGMTGNITEMPAESDSSDQAQLIRALITFAQWFRELA